MWNSQDRPLPPGGKEAFKILREEIHAADGYPHQQALDSLVAEGFPEVEAEELLDTLLQRGYFYAVDDELFVTTPEMDIDGDSPE